MNLVSTYLSEWMQLKQKHSNKVDVLSSRIAPIEEELERLDDKLRKLEDDFPTWHDNVAYPIINEIRNAGLRVEPLNDITVLQVPVMVIIPGTNTDQPKMVNVLIRLLDKTSGDFFVQITGYGSAGSVHKKLLSNNSLDVDTIIDAIKTIGNKI